MATTAAWRMHCRPLSPPAARKLAEGVPGQRVTAQRVAVVFMMCSLFVGTSRSGLDRGSDGHRYAPLTQPVHSRYILG